MGSQTWRPRIPGLSPISRAQATPFRFGEPLESPSGHATSYSGTVTHSFPRCAFRGREVQEANGPMVTRF